MILCNILGFQINHDKYLEIDHLIMHCCISSGDLPWEAKVSAGRGSYSSGAKETKNTNCWGWSYRLLDFLFDKVQYLL